MPSASKILRLLQAAAILLLGAGLLITMFFFIGHSILYHPHPYTAGYRKLFPPGLVELRFRSAAGQQTAFYLPPRNSVGLPGHIWVAFCGNGSLALDWLPLVTRDRSRGNAFLLIDYPGYGKSEGWPNPSNTRGTANDALAALSDHLRMPKTSLEPRLNAIGHSLGAAAALDFATEHQIGTVILLAPFTSLREEAACFFGRWLSHLMPNDYDNRAALRALARRHPPPRVVIFHGLQDALIPSSMSATLAAEFPGFITFHRMQDANHDTVVAAAAEQILALMSEE